MPEVNAKQAAKKGIPSLAELETTILSLVQNLIGPDVTPDAPLSSQGLDSLAGMELRQKLQVSFCQNMCPHISKVRHHKRNIQQISKTQAWDVGNVDQISAVALCRIGWAWS